MIARAADPYRDTDVIDSRAPRFNQAVVGVVSVLAVVTGWWWLLTLLALQLAVGVTFGRRFCLPCLAYFELVQPRFGEGELEDARPPRVANMVGIVVLGAASFAYAAGWGTGGVGAGVARVVAGAGDGVTGGVAWEPAKGGDVWAGEECDLFVAARGAATARDV